jgi:hypothetical protein
VPHYEWYLATARPTDDRRAEALVQAVRRRLDVARASSPASRR